jgi:uncharacterized repeat protein (TIGR02543 family)
MRKVLSLLIAVCLVLSLFTGVFAPVPHAKALSEGDYTYDLNGTVPETATITGYTGLGGVVVIPATLGTSPPYPVTNIGSEAFSFCTGLTSVTIPNSVTTIGTSAFGYCSGLTSVTIGSGVTSIDDCAFQGCLALTSIVIPDNVTTIGYGAFLRCSGLTSVTIGSGVTSIGAYAFQDCALTSVTIGSGVATIGDGAFLRCSALTSVIIPDSVTTIGAEAFRDCAALISVTIGSGVATIGYGAFQSCWALTSVIIPNSVTTIGTSTFLGCTGLASVIIPNSVTTIGTAAFGYCSGLTSVTIPDSVTSIGGWAFEACSALTSVTIPDSVTTIGDYAFYGCSGLTSVTIPDSVTSIGDGAFSGSTALTSVTIGIGVTSIGTNAFQGCTALSSVTIPDSVTSIGDGAFQGCTNLTAANFLGNAPAMGTDVFGGCATGFIVWCASGMTGWTNPWHTYPTATTGDASPDLTVDTLYFEPPQLTSGGSVRLYFTIRNQGLAPVTADCLNYTYIDGVKHATGNDTTRLASGAWQEWYCDMTWPSDSATHTLMVVADPTGVITESNESNNSASLSASASGTAPSITVASPTDGTVWSVGETRSITWTVSGNTSGIAYFVLGYSVDGGLHYDLLDNVSTAPSTATSYSWIIPNTPSSQCIILVVAADSDDNPVCGDFSSGLFTISTTPSTMYTLTTTASPPAGGSIMRSSDAASYASGTVVTLTASPAIGYTFTGWSGDLTGTTNPTTITMDGNKTVTATFAPSSGTSFSLSLLPSWNVISVPFATPVGLLTACDLFLSWDGSLWQGVTSLLPGTGYLVRNTGGSTTVTLTGTPSSSPQTQPATGTWQIIGNPYTTPASFACTSSVPYLLFWDGSLWQMASPTNLPPGLGFLLQASSSGTITLNGLP